MVVLTTKMVGQFNASLKIAGNLTLHDQMSLHTALNKLVLTSHYICLNYILICLMSATYETLVSFRLHDSGALTANFEQVIAYISRFLCCLLLDIDLFHVSSI